MQTDAHWQVESLAVFLLAPRLRHTYVTRADYLVLRNEMQQTGLDSMPPRAPRAPMDKPPKKRAPSAAGWVGLMEANDLPRALANCKGSSAYADPAGRKVCAVPLYVEPLKRAP